MNRLKQDSEYVLSIAIPTFASQNDLKNTVNDILKMKRDDIEIVIVDNDPTGEQIGPFMESLDDARIKYYRNKTNIGRTKNIVKAIECASSDFVLIMSDNDRIFEDGVNVIIDNARKHPDFGLIMGKIRVDMEGAWGYVGENRIYRKGYVALMVTPWMGDLFPFVVNKKYLDFDELYAQKENYMQTRIAYILAGRGDFIGLDMEIGYAVDNYTVSIKKCHEKKSVVNWNSPEIRITFDMVGDDGECYFSPLERCNQLKKDIITVENHRLRRSHLLRVIDKFTSSTINKVLDYVGACQDMECRVDSGIIPIMGYRDVLSVFEREMMPFFQAREKEEKYYFTGRIEDKIKNEFLILKEAELLFGEIFQEEEVYLYNISDKLQLWKLSEILKIMGIKTCDVPTGRMALVSDIYDSDIEARLIRSDVKCIRFMDWMSRYLTVVWCDKHQNIENANAYALYL